MSVTRTMRLGSRLGSGRPTIGIAALALYAGVCWFGNADASASYIGLRVQYPSEGAHIPFVTRSFVFGAAPVGSSVWVNGRSAFVARDGGWIAYVPFQPGTFVLHGTARAGTEVLSFERTVHVALPPSTTPAKPAAVDVSEAPLPREDLEVGGGDLIHLAVKASAGARVTANIPGIARDVPLAEFRRAIAGSQQQSALGGISPDHMVAGLYEGDVRVPPAMTAAQARVIYTVVAGDGATTASATSAGTVTVDLRVTPRVGYVVERRREADIGMQPYGIVETSPGGGWLFFPPPQTPFEVTGKHGHFFRVALGSAQSGWIVDTSFALVPAGAPVPRADTENVEIIDGTGSTTVIVHLTGRVPFRVDESPQGPTYLVRLYGAQTDTDYVRYGSDRGAVRAIAWDELPGDVAQIHIALRQRTLWGYRARWRGSDLALTIKKPPAFAPTAKAVRGLLIVIDPGHSPDSGAIGPLGTQERTVNLAIAKRLAARLRKMGARTALTRSTNAGVALYERPRIAAELGADALISVHNNALPDGVDPFSHHGFSVYYYQPQSLALARAIHRSYRRYTHLPDYGLFYDNLALARPTEEPAVLTESAFIAWPPEEMLLRKPWFQDYLGFVIADGVEHWAEQMRALESR